MSQASEWIYELERARRQLIYNERVSERTEQFYNRYMEQLNRMKQEGLTAYIPDEISRLENDLGRVRDLLILNPTEAREISMDIGEYISGLWSLSRSAKSQFERAERMRVQAETERKKKQQNALMQEYYDKLSSISPAVVHFAESELNGLRTEIESGKNITTADIDSRIAAIESIAKQKAAAWKVEHTQRSKQESVVSRIEEMETSVENEKIEDKEKANSLLQQIKRLKENVQNGSVDAETASKQLSDTETQVEEALVTEEVRRQTVVAFMKMLRDQGFTVGKPTIIKEGNDNVVKFTAQRPSGNRAECRFDTHGKVKYKFDNYEGMSCLKDIEQAHATLESVYSVRLSDERILWKNPDRLTKDADKMPDSNTRRNG